MPRTWRGRLILLTAAAALPGVIALSGCGAAGASGAAGAASGTAAAGGTVATGSTAPAAVRTDVPEPARAPALTQRPAGRVVPMPGAPEGLAMDVSGGIVAVGVRDPDGVALVDAATGRVRTLVRLPSAPRHLQLAGPAGPVLVPAEQSGQLFQVALPSGAVIAATRVGRQPHDAAAIGQTVFVGNEYSNTVSLVRGGKQVAVEPAPLQPGGVASNGEFVVVVGVRGRQIEAYTVDDRRGLVYVTLTATNQLESFRITGDGLAPAQTWPTVRQPNDVAVDNATGEVFVAGRDDNQLQLITPGTPAS